MLSFSLLFFSLSALAQDYGGSDSESAMYMGFMILGGFVMMAVVGFLIALSIYLMRKSRHFPRHARRT